MLRYVNILFKIFYTSMSAIFIVKFCHFQSLVTEKSSIFRWFSIFESKEIIRELIKLRENLTLRSMIAKSNDHPVYPIDRIALVYM